MDTHRIQENNKVQRFFDTKQERQDYGTNP